MVVDPGEGGYQWGDDAVVSRSHDKEGKRKDESGSLLKGVAVEEDATGFGEEPLRVKKW